MTKIVNYLDTLFGLKRSGGTDTTTTTSTTTTRSTPLASDGVVPTDYGERDVKYVVVTLGPSFVIPK